MNNHIIAEKLSDDDEIGSRLKEFLEEIDRFSIQSFINSICQKLETEIMSMSKDGFLNNLFQGATINNLTINSGGATNIYDEHYYKGSDKKQNDSNYSDEQIARALTNVVGVGKPIDSKQKWAGAMWLLRWRCNFPVKAQEFCQRINSLPFDEEPQIKCEYNNIRLLSTLSFMNQDARELEAVKYSKQDEHIFFQLREVVVGLDKELQKSRDYKQVI